MSATATMREVPQYINGEWGKSSAPATLPVMNPSIGEQIAAVPNSTIDEVNQAVEAAQAAFGPWSRLSTIERARVLFKFKALMEDAFEELVQLVTTEHGKTYEESKGDVRRGIEMVEFACSISNMFKGEILENVGGGVQTESARHPLGVCIGITPFNFPCMVPLWMFPVAIACGNTFVLKPSEKVPLTAVRLAELLEKAGLPKGVFNIVHGGLEVVNALIDHKYTRAVSFVGSTPVAQAVYERATRQNKRCQAAGGAKNFMFIMPDAKWDDAIAAAIGSAYGCAGERCMAGSAAIAVGGSHKEFIPRLREAADNIKVGPTDRDRTVHMGAVITREHRDRVMSYVDIAKKDGATIARDGRDIKVDAAPNGFFVGPTIFDATPHEARVVREEIFGPVLTVLHADDLHAAIEIANRSQYGNAGVIFTQNGHAAREFRDHINAGMVGINVGVPAPVAQFPFTGWNRSFFGDLHIQGPEGVQFYTQTKVTVSRWTGVKYF